MYAAIMSTWALLAGIALIMLGNGLQGTLLGVRAAQEGFETVATGLVMTSYFAGFLAGSMLTIRIVRRVGHVRVFAALASVASAAVLLHALLVSPWFWGVVRFATGLCFAGMYVIAESWLNDRATNETRGALLSTYMLITLAAMISGQMLINLGDTRSFELFVLASVLVSLAVVPIALTAAPAPRFEMSASVSIRQLYETSPLGVIGMMGQGVANGALLAMAPVYAQVVGMSIPQTAWFSAAPVIGGFLLQWPVGRLSDYWDRRKVLTVSAFLGAAMGAGAALMTDDTAFAIQFVVAALVGGFTFPQYALCIAHTNDHLQADQMTAASSTLVLAGGIGLVLGPTCAAALMSNYDSQGLFVTVAIVELMLGGFALYRMTARAPVPLDEQGIFVPLNSRTTTALVQAAAVQNALEEEEGSKAN
jgi:MFS family permease